MWDRPRRSPAVSSTRSTSSRQAHPMPSPLRPFVLAVIVSCAAALAGSGCDSTITSSEALPPLEAASIDADAGSWRMILLSGPTQFTVAAPAAETSAAYAAELAAIKTAQSNLTAAQRGSIDYWAGGGGLRWNQIVRELVARVNLPPAPRPDGLSPAAVAEITQRAAEQRSAALWSGKATASDIAAGLALGKAVGTALIARAGADGMKNAVGIPAQWQALADSAVAHGEIPWISQE